MPPGVVVAPPSVHPSGGAYAWAEGRGPDEIALAPLPVWLTELSLGGKVPQQPNAKVVTDLDAGQLTFTGERAGTYFLSYDAAFGNAPLDQGTVRVDVKARPKRAADPIAMPDTLTVYGQAPGIVDVLANDDDLDLDDHPATLRVDLLLPPSAASGATVTASGLPGAGISYDPDSTTSFESLAAGETTTDVIVYHVADGRGGVSESTRVSVTVTGVNDLPNSGSVSIEAFEDGSTVLGTANVMSAATLAEGTTTIECAACEPEVVEVATLLNAMGARISGAGGPRVTIEGVKSLGGADQAILPDRIVAGTYAIAAAITDGDVTIDGFP